MASDADGSFSPPPTAPGNVEPVAAEAPVAKARARLAWPDHDARAGASWGLLIGAAVGFADIVPSGTANAVSGGHFLLEMALLGALLGTTLADVMPARLRKATWITLTVLGALGAFFIPGWPEGGPPEWHRYFMADIGIAVAALGLLWLQLGKRTGARTFVAGITIAIAASLTHPHPVIWPLIPALVATYVPLFLWRRLDWWLRGAGLVGNVTAIALIQPLSPSWLLAGSFAPFALAVVYLFVMVLRHLFRDADAATGRSLAIWYIVFFATATLVAATDGLGIFDWLPTLGLLPMLAALGALYTGTHDRKRSMCRWGSVGLGALCVLLGLSTMVGRIREGDAVWQSLILMGFGAVVAVAWSWLPLRIQEDAPAPAGA